MTPDQLITSTHKPVKDVTNTVNYQRLPADYDRLELNYRAEPKPPPKSAAQGVSTIVAMVMVGILFTALTTLVGPMLTSWHAFSWFTGVFFAIGMFYFGKTRKAGPAVLIMVSGPLVCTLLMVVHPMTSFAGTRVLLLIATVPVLVWFVDRVAKHYAYWMMANPRLSRSTRERCEKAFAKRFTLFPLPFSIADLKLYVRALRDRLRSFRQGCRRIPAKRFFLLLVPFTKKGRQVYGDVYRSLLDKLPTRNKRQAAAKQRHDPDSLLGDDDRRRLAQAELRFYKFRFFYPLVVLVAFLPTSSDCGLLSLVFPLVVLALFLFALFTLGFSPRQMIRVTTSAFTNWFSYGRGLIDAPGVFRSPCGSYRRRLVVSLGVVVVLTLGLLPAVSYMPLAYELGYREPYTQHFDVLKEEAAYSPESQIAFAKLCGFSLYENEPSRPYTNDREAINRWQSRTKRWEKNQGQMWRYDVVEANFIDTRPENWLQLAFMAFGDPDGTIVVHLVIATLGCLAFPSLILLSTCLVVAGPTLTLLYRAVESDDAYEAKEQLDCTTWSCYAKRLEESANKQERNHLWLGSHRDDSYPVLLDKSILSEHTYIVGDSGSGKTALGITPLVTQLIRGGDDAVVIIDLKGDNALFQAVRKETEDAGRTFKWFTNELGRSTYVFNPFAQQVDQSHVSVNQVCETMLEALNLNHGEGYGRSFFSRVARRWLAGMLRRRPDIQSFKELYEMASNRENFADEKEMQDAFELLAVIESLSSFEQLNAEQGTDATNSVFENAIRMPEVIAEGQVAYFWLPSAAETATVREVAKLALYSLITSAYRHTRETGKAKQSYLVIDEFQRIASDGFKLILQQARSMGVGAILANQTSADLKTHDTDLRATVQTNTRFKWCFSATDLDQQDDIMKASGEAVYHLQGWSQNQSGPSSSVRETVLPRISRNDVIRTSDDPLQSIVHVCRGSGYTQFSGFSIPVVVSHHITLKQYEERSAAGWPEDNENTIVATKPPLDPERFASAEDRLHESKIMVDEEPEEAKNKTTVHVVTKEPTQPQKKASHYADMLDELGAEEQQDT